MNILQILWYLMAFLLMLTPLVFIHELGHFLFAKLFNVKVKTFSIFMGKKLFVKKWGETEYCISSIPIGGYVSMVGEDPTQELTEDEQKRALFHQAFYKKFLVVAAGPIFNIIAAIGIYMIIIAAGEQIPSNKVARIVPHSTAYKAGLQINDKIQKINGSEISNAQDLIETIKPLKDVTISVEYLRNGTKHTTTLKTSEVDDIDKFGSPTKVGSIHGLEISPLSTVIGISEPNSHVGKLGMKTGDRITTVENKKITKWHELSTSIISSKNNVAGSKIPLTVERRIDGKSSEIPFTLIVSRKIIDLEKDLGFESANMFIRKFVKTEDNEPYPAEAAGIMIDDKLVAVDDVTVHSFHDFMYSVTGRKDLTKPLKISIKRNGQLRHFTLVRKQNKSKNMVGDTQTRYLIGVSPYPSLTIPDMVTLETHGFIDITNKAIERSFFLTKFMIIGLGKLLTGEISPKKLSGPLMIGKIAGDTLSMGLIFFFNLMALISLNLAFVNLIPFPALDGGHIVIMVVEFIIRRKLPTKIIGTISYIGFFFLLSMMLAITFNDIFKFLF